MPVGSRADWSHFTDAPAPCAQLPKAMPFDSKRRMWGRFKPLLEL